MTGLSFISNAPADTQVLGTVLARHLRAGDVVLLVGEVGAGKTTLVRAVARALGVEEPVTSPTFTLANRYTGDREILHIDAYRLGSADDEDIGLLLDDSHDAVTFIEWPEALDQAGVSPRLTVRLDHLAKDSRRITLDGPADGTLVDVVRAGIDEGGVQVDDSL